MANPETVGARTSEQNLSARAILCSERDAPSREGASTTSAAVAGRLIEVASGLQLNSDSVQSVLREVSLSVWAPDDLVAHREVVGDVLYVGSNSLLGLDGLSSACGEIILRKKSASNESRK